MAQEIAHTKTENKNNLQKKLIPLVPIFWAMQPETADKVSSAVQLPQPQEHQCNTFYVLARHLQYNMHNNYLALLI